MELEYRINATVTPSCLNELRLENWPGVGALDWETMRAHSLFWVCTFDKDRLVGFVNVVGDGGSHAFILDTVVAATHRMNGIGTKLVNIAADEARNKGAEWLHVDYEDELTAFYQGCGFRSTPAGLRRLACRTPAATNLRCPQSDASLHNGKPFPIKPR